jgi:hypothetical protein
MVGNILLTTLDPGSPYPHGYSETDERQQVANGDWEIYGHDIYEDETLDQAPHKHCFDLTSVNPGDPDRRNLWNEGNHFSDRFKTWYYRWAAHLYNSMTSPDVALAEYDKFKYVDPETEREVETEFQYSQRVEGKNLPFSGAEPYNPPHVYPRKQFGVVPYMSYEYKLMTGYDIAHSPEMFTFDSSLNVST